MRKHFGWMKAKFGAEENHNERTVCMKKELLVQSNLDYLDSSGLQ